MKFLIKSEIFSLKLIHPGFLGFELSWSQLDPLTTPRFWISQQGLADNFLAVLKSSNLTVLSSVRLPGMGSQTRLERTRYGMPDSTRASSETTMLKRLWWWTNIRQIFQMKLQGVAYYHTRFSLHLAKISQQNVSISQWQQIQAIYTWTINENEAIRFVHNFDRNVWCLTQQ
jgi:hypothetical protein